ncbi:hypothetical protein CGC20_13905 [Leishmania donovani]|uniref:Uncharacterized protein n=1 Tax=Leishmania donovani TaxID=5661 RepID=A0A504WVB1_LEIDO|nr:hypothetical protein CGC20_13905 [Leishmania donovani]
MREAEAVRYDRQIRLWGKSTQQQLMHTSVALHGVAGAAAEAAKNLVLAGVRAVAVADEGLVTDADDAVPHVQAALPCADIVALHATCGPTVLALFLYRRLPAHSLAEQWRCLVAEPSLLAEKPRGYQRAVLALHVRTEAVSLGFAAAAGKAYEVVSRLQLQQLTAADVQDVLQTCAHGAGSADCVSDTIAGACIAQHLIRQIGALNQPPDAQSYHWMLCECGAEVECLVGL